MNGQTPVSEKKPQLPQATKPALLADYAASAVRTVGAEIEGLKALTAALQG